MRLSHARLLTGLALALALAVAAVAWALQVMHGRPAGGGLITATSANTKSHFAAGTASRDPSSPAVTAATYDGGQACGSCHAAERAAWLTSHHARSMQPASEHTVLGNFCDAAFKQGNRSVRFFRRDGRHYVRTDGPDGKPMRARNFSRRVVFFLAANSAWAKVV